jgi:hypothetical protein
MTMPVQLAVFPLPVYLLPKGKTRLRIFEPRYIRMVKESVGGQGFVISLHRDTKPYPSADWGAWVEVIDFEQLPDGLLGITVEAKSLVSLSDFYYEADNLLKAKVELKSHWSESPESEANQAPKPLFQAYDELLKQQPLLQNLYQEPSLQSATWVVGRWLEVLPLSFECRERLAQQNSFQLAVETVETIVLGK